MTDKQRAILEKMANPRISGLYGLEAEAVKAVLYDHYMLLSACNEFVGSFDRLRAIIAQTKGESSCNT